ncbi:hypothetical protein ABI_38910 [Asticcacaulis biprosthecium C19]|uniref:Uncharacterized protein n=1 Tax=Asticcacaulis biprosthecium C19 TaxID=715226 RepID=F4QRV7_9CAUL|nr:hypothetical protein ABI_38910 [Asticcacaulis biprosthecium C19]
MDEDSCLVFWQNDIWLSWEVAKILPEAESRPVQQGAQQDLGFGVLALNP